VWGALIPCVLIFRSALARRRDLGGGLLRGSWAAWPHLHAARVPFVGRSGHLTPGRGRSLHRCPASVEQQLRSAQRMIRVLSRLPVLYVTVAWRDAKPGSAAAAENKPRCAVRFAWSLGSAAISPLRRICVARSLRRRCDFYFDAVAIPYPRTRIASTRASMRSLRPLHNRANP